MRTIVLQAMHVFLIGTVCVSTGCTTEPEVEMQGGAAERKPSAMPAPGEAPAVGSAAAEMAPTAISLPPELDFELSSPDETNLFLRVITPGGAIIDYEHPPSEGAQFASVDCGVPGAQFDRIWWAAAPAPPPPTGRYIIEVINYPGEYCLQGSGDYTLTIRANGSEQTYHGSHNDDVTEPGIFLRVFVDYPVPTRDLITAWISREPAMNNVWDSPQPDIDGWPAVGQTITWRAHVRNKSTQPATGVSYRWFMNTLPIAAGTVDIPANGMATVDLPWSWTFQPKTLQFYIDSMGEIAETEEANNGLKIFTDAISVGLYVEQGVYDYFDAYQRYLGVGSNSWEDWAQRQVQMWNKIFASAIYPEAPAGVLDRIRLDKIVVVPNGALPLAGGLPTNSPNRNDRTVDLQWGFPMNASIPTFYGDHKTADTTNPFYYERSLLHELGHARYLVDIYGWNVRVNKNNKVRITEHGAPIVGTSYMPFLTKDTVHYTPHKGLMNETDPFVDRYSTIALNLIEGHRPIRENYNAPSNIGSFLNDLPAENELTVMDEKGNLLPGASVSIYRAAPSIGFYAKDFDDLPDMTLVADQDARVYLGRCPFSADGTIVHNSNFSNGVVIVRVESGGNVGYGFLESLDFNLEYWRGNTALARHELRVALQ